MADLVTIAGALDAILTRAQLLGTEIVAIRDAHGRILAETAVSAVDLPPFPSSAMDGYAVRAADTPGELSVVGSAAAGRPAGRRLARGEAIAIATGAVVPEGADSVAPIEVVVERDNSVRRPGGCHSGGQRAPAGRGRASGRGPRAGGSEDRRRADRRARGSRRDRARLRPPPRVRLLTTGTELRAPGETLGDGEIYESNSAMLEAALLAAGATVEILPPVEDDPAAHRAALEAGLEADVLVTSGGVSVGTHDLVRGIGRDLGVTEVFWGVAMRPGKPFFFGARAETLVFGLPGNPVSSLVGALLFVRPALLALQGAAEPGPLWLDGALAAGLARASQRDELVRARVSSTELGVLLTPISGQESHMVRRAALADALVHVARGEGELAAGSRVRYLRLD